MKNLISKFLIKLKGQRNARIITDKKQEFLIKLGKEQFEKLVARGLSIPVMTL